MRRRFTRFRPRIRSRHPSHDILRAVNRTLPLFPFKSVIRFGSSSDMRDTISNGGDRIEVNIIEAIKNSANKLRMKTKFTEFEVISPEWYKIKPYSPNGDNNYEKVFYGGSNNYEAVSLDSEEINYPIVSKHIYGSRGTGNRKHNTKEELEAWIEGKNLDNYIFERFHNYVREYRLHVTEDGCFYACRKMLRRDTPEEARWYRNDDHCVWILEENESFDKPSNWEDIVEHSVRALKAVGLDVGAVDVKVQSATNRDGEIREEPSFIIIEINSAPSFGSVTEQKYIEELPKILIRKNNQHNE